MDDRRRRPCETPSVNFEFNLTAKGFAEPTGKPSAEDHPIEIQQRDNARDRCRECRTGLSNEAASQRIILIERLLPGTRFDSTFPPEPLQRCCLGWISQLDSFLEGGPARVVFQLSSTNPHTVSEVGERNKRVPDLASKASTALSEYSVQDEPGSNPGPDEQPQEIVGPAARSEAVLGQRGKVAVVANQDLPSAKPLGQAVGDSHIVGPIREVRCCGDHSRPGEHRSGYSNSDRTVGTTKVDLSDRLRYCVKDIVWRPGARCVEFDPFNYPTSVNDDGKNLGPAEINPDRPPHRGFNYLPGRLQGSRGPIRPECVHARRRG